MRGARHRVLVDPVIGGEHPADDILLVPFRSYHHQPIEIPKRCEIRPHRPDCRFVSKKDNRAIVAALSHKGLAADPERFAQSFDLARAHRISREVELQQIAIAADRQDPGASPEADAFALDQYMGGRESCMAA